VKPPLYILAGGSSRRFGSDKARAVYRGLPLVAHVASALAEVTTSVVIVADRAGRYADLGFETIGDHHSGLGPLAGLDRALSDHAERHPEPPWLMLASCDLVDPDPSWVDSLLARRDGVLAVAFRGPQGWEPLFALYHADLRDEVRSRLRGGDRSLQALLDGVAAAAVPAPASYRHVSTPDELRRSPGYR
jgi:molybdenum cofactor guanylyltransferase